MTPAEAQRVLEEVKVRHNGPHLRIVSSIDNPEASGPGEKLQNARMQKGISVVEAANALKLRPDQIAAIEGMEFSRLPGLGYAMGYVNTYAELLNVVDKKQLVEDYRTAWEPEQKRQESQRVKFDKKMALPLGFMVFAAIFAWLFISASVGATLPQKTDTDVIARPDAEIKAWANPTNNVVGRAALTIDPLVTINASRNVHVSLRGQDGALVTDRYLNAGEHLNTDGLGRFIIATDDAGALTVNGYGMKVPVGDNGVKVENWRAPDLKAESDKKSAEAAAEAKAKADAEAAKKLEQEQKNSAKNK